MRIIGWLSLSQYFFFRLFLQFHGSILLAILLNGWSHQLRIKKSSDSVVPELRKISPYQFNYLLSRVRLEVLQCYPGSFHGLLINCHTSVQEATICLDKFIECFEFIHAVKLINKIHTIHECQIKCLKHSVFMHVDLKIYLADQKSGFNFSVQSLSYLSPAL